MLFMNQFLYAVDFWEKIDLDNHYVTAIAEDSKDNLYISTISIHNDFSARGIYKSTNNGDSWIKIGIDSLISSIVSLRIDKNDIIYAGIQNSGGVRSDDDGKTWIQINNGIRTNLGNYPSITDFEFNENGEVFAVCDYFGIIKSTNNGDLWERKGFPSYFNNWGLYATIHKIKNNNYLATCTDGIYIFDDAKNTFNIIYADSTMGNDPPEVRDITNNSNGCFFASILADSNIFSSDNGKTWSGLTYKGKGFFYSTFITTDYQNNLYTTYYEEVNEPPRFRCEFLKSSDNGITWVNMNYNIPDSIQFSKMFINRKGYIFLFNTNLSRNYLYRSSAPVVGVEEHNKPINQIEISPNPASNYVCINGESESDKIEIYSIFGINIIKSEYKDKIDVSALAPGMYFVRIGYKVSKFIKI
jgi:hypothetical protein